MQRERRIDRVVGLVLVVVAGGIVAIGLLSSAAQVRIVDTSPANGSDDVPITALIRVAFSQHMDTASVEAHFHIEPEVSGRLVWDGKQAIFQPGIALTPGTTYTVSLDGAAMNQRGSSLKQSHAWHFRTRAPQLLYLGRPAPDADLRQLFVTGFNGSPPRQLTEHQWGVWDYAVHPLGEAIVYSALRQDGGSDLWRMDHGGADPQVLLACPKAACLNPVWSPDGKQLAYERRDIWAAAPNLDPSAARIWLYDVKREETQPLFDYDVPLHSPVWAPGGERLACVSPILPGVEIYDLRTKELLQFSNQWGSAPVWSPDGHHLAMSDLVLIEETLLVRLIGVDLQDGIAIDISGEDDLVKDVAPAWSPGGGWIAFGRQFLDEERWTPGRQIWLTRPDASEAYPLLAEPMADLFAFAWRPDGAALAYLRADLAEGPQMVPDVSVWTFDLVRREPLFVADHAVLPKWLP
jgi:Tol biopolymer transport system component